MAFKMLNFIRQGNNFRQGPASGFCEKGRQILHQLPGLIAIVANHRFERIRKRVEQEVRVHLRVQQFDFRLRQQRFCRSY